MLADAMVAQERVLPLRLMRGIVSVVYQAKSKVSKVFADRNAAVRTLQALFKY